MKCEDAMQLLWVRYSMPDAPQQRAQSFLAKSLSDIVLDYRSVAQNYSEILSFRAAFGLLK